MIKLKPKQKRYRGIILAFIETIVYYKINKI